MRRIRSVNNRLYLLVDKIGRGASSIVFEARPIEYNSSINPNLLENPSQSRAQQTSMQPLQQESIKFLGKDSVALKIMNLKDQNATIGEGTQLKKIKEIQTQLQILSTLNMEGVIKLIDFEFSEDSQMIMVLEYCGLGCFNDLLQLIQDYEGLQKNREEILIYYLSQLIATLSSLGAYGISHRDIKAENIVFDSKYRLKLIDFASAEIVDAKLFARLEPKEGDARLAEVLLKIRQFQEKQSSKSKSGGYIGSRHYISPEMIGRARTKELQENLLYYSKTDAWSLGVLIYKLFAKVYPFDGENNFQILRAIRKDQPDLEKLPHHLKPIVKGLLVKQVENRLTLQSLQSMLPFSNYLENKQLCNSPSPILKLEQSPIQNDIIYEGDLLVGKINAVLIKKRVVILNKQIKLEFTKEQKAEEGNISSGQLIADHEVSIRINDKFSDQNQFSSAKMLTEPENKQEHLVGGLEETPSMTKMLSSHKKPFICIMKVDCNLLQKQFEINKSVSFSKQEGSTLLLKGKIEDDLKKKENSWSMALKAENQSIMEQIYEILQKVILSLE